MTTYKGTCFCGSVTIRADGAPAAMGYCHCSSCRAWSAAPVTAFSLWKPENMRVESGAGHMAVFARTAASERHYCTRCGGHLMTVHPGFGLTDVYPAILKDFVFAPGVHVNYAETVLPMRDGLPKLKDFPSELGGSGEAMTE